MQFFNSMAKSFLNIISCSPNRTFRKRSKNLIRVICSHSPSSASFLHRGELICPTQTLLRDHATAFKTSSTSLANYLSQFEDGEECAKAVMEFSKYTTGRLTDQEAICLAFEHIFRIGVRRPLFKVGSFVLPTFKWPEGLLPGSVVLRRDQVCHSTQLRP